MTDPPKMRISQKVSQIPPPHARPHMRCVNVVAVHPRESYLTRAFSHSQGQEETHAVVDAIVVFVPILLI